MASEIERLLDLEGFLKLASDPDWRRVRLTRRDYGDDLRSKPSFTAANTLIVPAGPSVSTPPAVLASKSSIGDADTAQSSKPTRKRGRKPRTAGPMSINAASPVVSSNTQPGSQ